MNEVVLDWLPKQGDVAWDNPLANLLTVFGLPGGRYTCSPVNTVMIVTFNSERDAALCRIMFSERLGSV